MDILKIFALNLTFKIGAAAMVDQYTLSPLSTAIFWNGFNRYNLIPSQFVSIDSTSEWPGNATRLFYSGASDTHYWGVYQSGVFD